MTKDETMTELLFARRVTKLHPRVVVCGLVDELNSHLGVSRVVVGNGQNGGTHESILKIQEQLLRLGSELSACDEDLERFRATYGEKMLAESDLAFLDDLCKDFGGKVRHFTLPGETLGEAQLHIARCVCRRLELQVIELKSLGYSVRDVLIRYVNRLSKALFTLARGR